MAENQVMDVVVKGLIINGGKALIVKRHAEDEIAAGTWECPGGKVEFGEDLEPALAREILEETGLKVSVGKILFATTLKIRPNRQAVFLTYLCSSESTEVRLSFEHSDYRWAGQQELKAMLPPDMAADFAKNDLFGLVG